jgi:hypothetical protein
MHVYSSCRPLLQLKCHVQSGYLLRFLLAESEFDSDVLPVLDDFTPQSSAADAEWEINLSRMIRWRLQGIQR